MSTTKTSVKLRRPLKEGDGEIAFVTLREPGAGDLRGIKLTELLQGDSGAVIRVAARVCTPGLSEPQIAELGARDFAAVFAALVGFFVDGEPDAAP